MSSMRTDFLYTSWMTFFAILRRYTFSLLLALSVRSYRSCQASQTKYMMKALEKFVIGLEKIKKIVLEFKNKPLDSLDLRNQFSSEVLSMQNEMNELILPHLSPIPHIFWILLELVLLFLVLLIPFASSSSNFALFSSVFRSHLPQLSQLLSK